jgi:SnoaL-like domain
MRLKELSFALLLLAGLAMPALGKDVNDKLLTYLADRLAIQDLMTAYGTAHNTTDPELYRQIFADDVKIISPEGKVEFDGIDALLVEVKNDRVRFNQGAKDGVRTYGVMRHLFTNMEINVTDKTATGRCYSLIITNNAPAKRPEILAMDRYNTEYVKRNGKWRISKMTIYVDWGSEEMAKMLQVGPYTPAQYR